MDFNRTELRAMLFATGLLLLGAAARLGLSPGPTALEWTRPPDHTGAVPDLSGTRGQVEAGLAEEELASRPLASGERLDPNTASAAELRRLPGIGPARAAAIVTERNTGGAFTDLDDLLRVPGIGSQTVRDLAPVLALPVGTARSGHRIRGGGNRTPARVDVNRAQIKELEQITGIGPVLATRIVETRRRLGPFREADDLLRVPGIGPGILQRIKGEVRF